MCIRDINSVSGHIYEGGRNFISCIVDRRSWKPHHAHQQGTYPFHVLDVDCDTRWDIIFTKLNHFKTLIFLFYKFYSWKHRQPAIIRTYTLINLQKQRLVMLWLWCTLGCIWMFYLISNQELFHSYCKICALYTLQ